MTYDQFKALKLSSKMKDLIKEIGTNPHKGREEYRRDSNTITALLNRDLINSKWSTKKYHWCWMLTTSGKEALKYCVEDVSLFELQSKIEALEDIANMPYRFLEQERIFRRKADECGKKYYKYKEAADKAAKELDLLKAELESLGVSNV